MDYFTSNLNPTYAGFTPGASTSTGPSTSRRAVDLTPQLAQAPEFRVPTHEAPQKVSTPRWTAPTPQSVQAVWERDETAPECRNCRRRFTFFLRKVCYSLEISNIVTDISAACMCTLCVAPRVIDVLGSIVDDVERYFAIAVLPVPPS